MVIKSFSNVLSHLFIIVLFFSIQSCDILQKSKTPTKRLTKFYITQLNDFSSMDSFMLKSEADYYCYNFNGGRFDTMLKFTNQSSPLYFIKISIDKKKLNGYLYQYRIFNNFERLINTCPILNGKIDGLCEDYALVGEELLTGICEYSNNERNGICVILSASGDFFLLRHYRNDKLHGKSILIHDLKDIIFYREYNKGNLRKTIMELYPGRYE
jgi:hypothetical protein